MIAGREGVFPQLVSLQQFVKEWNEPPHGSSFHFFGPFEDFVFVIAQGVMGEDGGDQRGMFDEVFEVEIGGVTEGLCGESF